MNWLDLLIVVLVASATVGGYRLGLVVRATSWIGLLLGVLIASRFLPDVARSLQDQDPGTRFLIATGVLVGAAFAGQLIGLAVGSTFHRVVPGGPLRQLDKAGGAIAGLVGVLVAVWLLIPSMADVPGLSASGARNSAIARLIDRLFPQPPDTLQALRRLVGPEGFPDVFNGIRPAPSAGPPPGSIPLADVVVGRVSASTVRVEGIACRRIQDGSGFATAPDTIVTNAHVVAGERDTSVLRPDGRRLSATVTLFDPDRDLAILRVPGLNQTPLPVASAKVGAQGAVFGHPNGQRQLEVSPAAIRQQVEAVGRDLYDRHETRRQVFIMASNLQPGDSGGALADTSGSVVGVAFAIAPDRPGIAYALTSTELRAVLAAGRAGKVDTGPCLAD